MPIFLSKRDGYNNGKRVYFLDMGGDAPPPPDYRPVAEASRETAELADRLGRDQLAFAQRQYDENMAIARPIVNTQQQIMQQGLTQGDDYYRYGTSFRPLEQEMLAQARGGLTAADVVRMNRAGLGGIRQAQTSFQERPVVGQQQVAVSTDKAPVSALPTPVASSGGGRNLYTGQSISGGASDGPRNMYSGMLIPDSGFETPAQAAISNADGLLAQPDRAAMLSPEVRAAHLDQVKTYRPELYQEYAARFAAIPGSAASTQPSGVAVFGGSSPGQLSPPTERTVGSVAGGLSKQYMPQSAVEQTAPTQGLSASTIAANNSASRANILASSQAQWQQQQDARRADLTRQIEAARAEEEAIRQRGLADARTRTEGLSMSYIDAQGNVRSADSYRNIAASTAQRDGSPGDGYQYFEYDNPNAGQQTARTVSSGDSDQTVYDTAPARTGAWLRTGRVGVADPSLSGAAPAAVDPKSLRSYQLQQQLDALGNEKFDASKADFSAADRAAGAQALDGAMVRAMLDQQEMDQITGTAQDNAARLAARTRAYEADAFGDIQDYTGGNERIINRYRSDIDADVGRAVADARMGQTSATNAALRQAMRYGLSVPGTVGSLTSGQASQIAAAANNTRNSAVDSYRALVGQGIGLKRDAFSTGQAATLDSMNKGEQALRAGRDMRIQNESLDWAKKLDVTGLARGMPGASQGAYSVATNAGNSAASNQMAPGQAMQGAMAQSASTQLNGRQIAQQGLTGVLNAQTSYANANQGGSDLGGLGALLGGAARIYTASDRRLKTNIEVVGRDEATGLKIYEFDYSTRPGRFRGVMADDVRALFPHAVIRDDSGFDKVDYAALGIEFVEIK